MIWSHGRSLRAWGLRIQRHVLQSQTCLCLILQPWCCQQPWNLHCARLMYAPARLRAPAPATGWRTGVQREATADLISVRGSCRGSFYSPINLHQGPLCFPTVCRATARMEAPQFPFCRRCLKPVTDCLKRKGKPGQRWPLDRAWGRTWTCSSRTRGWAWAWRGRCPGWWCRCWGAGGRAPPTSCCRRGWRPEGHSRQDDTRVERACEPGRTCVLGNRQKQGPPALTPSLQMQKQKNGIPGFQWGRLLWQPPQSLAIIFAFYIYPHWRETKDEHSEGSSPSHKE